MTSSNNIDKPKLTINRLNAATRVVLEDWCRKNHRRLAQQRVTRQQAALIAMRDLAPLFERIRTRFRISKPILIKPSNIKAAYAIVGLVWHRGNKVTLRLTKP